MFLRWVFSFLQRPLLNGVYKIVRVFVLRGTLRNTPRRDPAMVFSFCRAFAEWGLYNCKGYCFAGTLLNTPRRVPTSRHVPAMAFSILRVGLLNGVYTIVRVFVLRGTLQNTPRRVPTSRRDHRRAFVYAPYMVVKAE